MEGIPALLAQGRELIRAAPAAWIERAADECAGLRKLFGEGIDLLIAEHAALAEPLRRAADRATIATAVFQQFLETELRGRANQRYACGAEAFDLLLRRGHFLAVDAPEVERYAEEQFVETEAYLSEHARDGAFERVRADLSGAVRGVGLILMLASAVLVVVAYPFAAVFQPGNLANTSALGNVIIAFAIGLVGFSVLFVVQRTFYALGDTRTPFLFTLVQVVVFTAAALTCLLLPVEWIAVGVALSTTIAGTAS